MSHTSCLQDAYQLNQTETNPNIVHGVLYDGTYYVAQCKWLDRPIVDEFQGGFQITHIEEN